MDKAHKIDLDTYYRIGSFTNFSAGAKCSLSITSKIDVTDLYIWSKKNGTKFYINFLYVLTKALNSRDDYKMEYRWQTKELYCYDKINPTHYVFFDDTEICTPVYSEYFDDYQKFYDGIVHDSAEAKKRHTYKNEGATHPNWFDASYVSWENYESLNIELPDGYLYFMPIINWGRFKKELVVSDDAELNTELSSTPLSASTPKAQVRLMMPLTVRMNHAIADGYLVSKVFDLVRQGCRELVETVR